MTCPSLHGTLRRDPEALWRHWVVGTNFWQPVKTGGKPFFAGTQRPKRWKMTCTFQIATSQDDAPESVYAKKCFYFLTTIVEICQKQMAKRAWQAVGINQTVRERHLTKHTRNVSG
jgi:hypothetical protein